MKIETVHGFLVHPDKAKTTQTPIKGRKIVASGPLLSLVTGIFMAPATDYPHEIIFDTPDGTQHNECRNLFIAYVADPSLANGLSIAERLQERTTNRSKLGLLFVMLGRQGTRKRLVVSRFPVGHGITASENAASLDVKFVEVFLREAAAFKSVMYEGTSTMAHFWTGRALDKQINDNASLAQYWIRDFLLSDFATTAAAGTRRLAIALKMAIRSVEDVGTKLELSSLVTLLPNTSGQVNSAAQLLETFHVSAAAVAATKAHFPNENTFNEQFEFSSAEFADHIAYRSVEVDNGGILTAPASEFDQVFSQQQLDETGRIRFATEGRIVDDRLRKTK